MLQGFSIGVTNKQTPRSFQHPRVGSGLVCLSRLEGAAVRSCRTRCEPRRSGRHHCRARLAGQPRMARCGGCSAPNKNGSRDKKCQAISVLNGASPLV